MSSRWRVAVGVCAAALLFVSLVGCGQDMPKTAQVLADTSFLADIAQNVAGDRLSVTPLVPLGADPHAFEPTPQDATKAAEARAIVINAPGLMPAVDALISGARGPGTRLIVAAAGIADLDKDPHCWLDPILVIVYAENIANGFAAVDPGGETVYMANAATYADALRELDAWIVAQVETIPIKRRLLVTNHESLGRFAARYGFEVVGTIFPNSTGEGSSPSARQIADLIGRIRATGTPAIFLETGTSADLAKQVAAEAGIRVVTDLYTHSLGDGAPTYLDMMRWNVTKIVEALR